MRVQVHIAKRRGAGNQLLIDSGLFLVGKRIGHLDDDHAIEQSFVFLLLQEFMELRQIGVSQNGLIQMNEWEAGYLDVLFLGQGEQQIKKLALHLEDFDHLKHAAARRVHGARPRPGTWVTFIADFGHFG